MKSKKYNQIIIIIVCILILIGIFLSISNIYLKKDKTKELNLENLEVHLKDNTELLLNHEEEYLSMVNNEKNTFDSTIKALEEEEEKTKEIINNLSITGVGDSVMLGAVENLEKIFSNGYFDAKVSRSISAGGQILEDLKEQNKLGDVIIINLGANGDCSEKCKDKIMDTIGDKLTFWLTVTDDEKVNFNTKIKAYAEKYSNLKIIDWESISKDHSEYFYKDGLHLTPKGRIAYANAIYNAILDEYSINYQEKIEEVKNEYSRIVNQRFSIYGNDLLINVYDLINTTFQDSSFTIIKNFTQLKEDITEKLENNSLNNKILFIFDKNLNITNEELTELITLLKDKEVYILMNNDIDTTNYDYVTIISNELTNNSNYLMDDNIHLNTFGNNKLKEILSKLK
jgi:hypothetical protein